MLYGFSVIFFMRNRPAIICILLLNLACSQAFGQTNQFLQGITAKLKKFSAEHIAEKAYLHFDKPYYAAGDTIYFKAYVTLGEKHELSGLSGVLHVDLINTANKINSSLKLQLRGGVAWGDFALPDSLAAGNYRVRAYTQWMRNDGDHAFFEQIVPIGSPLNVKVPEGGALAPPKLNSKPDLQFFPESGQLVTGLVCKVAFKAVGANGLGIAAQGIVDDNTGNEVCRFNTAHAGMGSFLLRPVPGKTYTAKVTYSNGLKDSVALPAATAYGIILKINNEGADAAALQIAASDAYFKANQDKDMGLIVYTSGFANAVNVKLDSATINLAILKRHLHTGITRVTLFSAEGEPLSERLLFMQNPDQLKLTVNTDKKTYGKREKVHLSINALTRADSAATGHFSVSVTDESKVPADENKQSTILTSLLLTSDLKGYIEEPNYYFSTVSGQSLSDLDLVMLTHGYRRFEWKRLLNDAYPPVAYQPEKGLEISGVAKSNWGKPLAKGTVWLISDRNGLLSSQKTNELGAYKFSNLMFNDTARFVLNAINSRGNNATRITCKKDENIPAITGAAIESSTVFDVSVATALANSQNQQEQINRYGRGTGKMLKEVKIKGTKIEPVVMTTRYGASDQVISGDKILYGGPLAVRLMGLLHSVHFARTSGNRYIPILRGHKMLIVWNDQEMDPEFDISSINTNDVQSIDVITNATSITPDHEGVIIIHTTFGLQQKDMMSAGILPITVMGFYKAREFYSPKYGHPNDTINRPDLRSTIYWKPELQTDKDGNASFEYYNADGTGNYRVVIEGIDNKGNLGRLVYRYKVE